MHKIKFWRSLKLRLFILILIAGTIPTIIVSMSILKGYEDRAIKVRTQDAQTQLSILANHLITYNYLVNPDSEVVNAELKLLSNLYSGRVMIIDNHLRIIKDTYGVSENKIIVADEIIKCINGMNTVNYDKENGFIEITVPIMDTVSEINESIDLPAGTEVCKGVLLTAVSTDTITATIEILSSRVRIFEIIIILLIFVVALIMSRALVKPFDKIQQEILNVSTGMSYETISVADYLETQHIVSAFNSLLERMRRIDESRQQFVANVSHELKTPMTSVKVLADSLNSNPDVPVEMYREFMQDITDEIERENKIINDLLALVKLDKDATALNITEVDINLLAENMLKRLRPIARKSDIEMTLVSLRQVKAEVDEVKISLVLLNLIENAIKYNNPNGHVTVTVDADHQFFTVTVADTGIGIPEEECEAIFERFYRVDKSHSREIGGTGLGLSIAKSAILRHKGNIYVESKAGEGSTFTIKVPLKCVQA